MGTSHDLTNQCSLPALLVDIEFMTGQKQGAPPWSSMVFLVPQAGHSEGRISCFLISQGPVVCSLQAVPERWTNKTWLKQTLKDGFIWFYHTQPDKRWNMLLIYRWWFNHAHVQHEKWMITDRFLYEKMGFNMFKPPTSESLFMNMPIFVILRIQITSEEKFTPWNMRWNHQHTFQHYILKCLVNGL